MKVIYKINERIKYVEEYRYIELDPNRPILLLINLTGNATQLNFKSHESAESFLYNLCKNGYNIYYLDKLNGSL